MAAHGGSVVMSRGHRGHMEEHVLKNNNINDSSEKGRDEALITRDLLGAWPCRLGSMKFKRCRSPIEEPVTSSSSSDHHRQCTELQGLNFFPSKSGGLDEDESRLGLELFPSSHYQSICTLDKVKSALDRAQREEKPKQTSVLQIPQNQEELKFEGEEKKQRQSDSSSPSSSFAAACPSCLMYVLTWKSNPLCPKCHCTIPSPSLAKKPRLDLNAASSNEAKGFFQ